MEEKVIDNTDKAEKESSMPMDKEQLQDATKLPKQEDSEQEPTSQEASPHGTSDKPQPAVSQSKEPDGKSKQETETQSADLETNTQLALNALKSGIGAGEHFLNIRKNELYNQRQNPKTQKAYTWPAYCRDFFGISIQYADRLMNGWTARNQMSNEIDEKDFNELPVTVNFWVELDKIPEAERGIVLRNLITQFKEKGKSLRRLRAKDILECQIDDEDDELSDDGNEVEEADEADENDEITGTEPNMDLDQMVEDVKAGRHPVHTDLAAASRMALRSKLEETLEESKKVQSNIESFLQMLDDEAEDEAKKGSEQLAS